MGNQKKCDKAKGYTSHKQHEEKLAAERINAVTQNRCSPRRAQDLKNCTRLSNLLLQTPGFATRGYTRSCIGFVVSVLVVSALMLGLSSNTHIRNGFRREPDRGCRG